MDIHLIANNDMKYISQCAEIISKEHAWQVYNIDYNKAVDILVTMPDKIYIAEKDNLVLGFITLRSQGVGNIGAYVRMLAVNQDYRGKSIGKNLVSYIQQKAELFGDKDIFLICSIENLVATSFYNKNGFERVGILSDLVVDGHDEILYRRKNKN